MMFQTAKAEKEKKESEEQKKKSAEQKKRKDGKKKDHLASAIGSETNESGAQTMPVEVLESMAQDVPELESFADAREPSTEGSQEQQPPAVAHDFEPVNNAEASAVDQNQDQETGPIPIFVIFIEICPSTASNIAIPTCHLVEELAGKCRFGK